MKYTRALSILAFVSFTLLLNNPVVQSAAGQNTGGNSSAKVLIPHESWNCGMPDGIPAPESGSLIFEIAMKFDKVLDVGRTPFGDRRVIVARRNAVGPVDGASCRAWTSS
jgi:hypothetical protein